MNAIVVGASSHSLLLRTLHLQITNLLSIEVAGPTVSFAPLQFLSRLEELEIEWWDGGQAHPLSDAQIDQIRGALPNLRDAGLLMNAGGHRSIASSTS
jgi:hypothetical protein